MEEFKDYLITKCIESTLYDIVIGTIAGLIVVLITLFIKWWRNRGKGEPDFLAIFKSDNIELSGIVPNSPETRSSVNNLVNVTFTKDTEEEIQSDEVDIDNDTE